MSKNSELELYQNFTQKQQQRAKVFIGGQIQAIFDYCEYIIHTQFDKKLKSKYKFKQRKKQVSEEFMRAYGEMQRTDKVMYYIKNVIYLLRINNGIMKVPKVRTDVMETQLYTLSYNIKRWKLKKMRLDNARQIMFGQHKNTIKQYDLGDYIFRGSKSSKYYTFVLEAINQSVQKKLKTVHLGFTSAEEMKQWADAVQLCIDYKHWQRIYIQLYKKQPPRQTMPIHTNKQILQKQRVKSTPIQLNNNQVFIKEEKKVIKQKIQQKPKVQEQFQQFQSESGNQQQIPQAQRTIIQDLVGNEIPVTDDIESIQNRNLTQNKNKNLKNLNIFHKMFPQFQFSQVQSQIYYELLQNENNLRIMQHTQQKQRYKIISEIDSQIDISQQIFKSICSPQLIKSYNQNVETCQIKTFISSQNAAIVYLVLKQFNRIYRPRDFVFIRHCFRIGNNAFYIADKDIENSNYPPFITIVRGKYQCVWAILRKQNKIKLVGNLLIDNVGYLSDNQNTNLTLNYIKYFAKLFDFAKVNSTNLKKYILFDLGWDITKNEQNKKQEQKRIRRNSQILQLKKKKQEQFAKKQIIALEDLNKNKQVISSKSNSKLKTNLQVDMSPQTKLKNKQKQLAIERQKMNLQKSQGQIDLKQIQNNKLQTKNEINLNFDNKGFVIIEKGFIRNKYQLIPINNYPIIYWKSPVQGKHPLWVNDWKQDTKNGGLLFINQKKIEDQKGVLKFILSKIGKNILSGKSVLNISLPVDIFIDKSNLELYSQSLCYAPILFQKITTSKQINKFKAVAAFGISMSPLYLIMQKPFNPILGQTFQAWINGCPVYAEQISHHPPILSFLFYGRGYTISGQIQSKAEVHVNSGTGTNQGIILVKFDDGTKFCFWAAGGQVSGLAYGDRKFNIKGKAYCWSLTQNYFCEISFNPSKKGFFSMKKQDQPEDYFEGDVVKVSKDFLKSLENKRRAPQEKQITESVGKIHGIWHQQYMYQNQILLDIEKQWPFKLQYEKHPLPSDSNWREDIAYRRLMQIPRAQNQKERLEVLQRKDKKLRENK